MEPMKMNKMVDMERTKAEAKKANQPYQLGSTDKFPYGLALSLEADALKKLGIKELPAVGDEYNILAVGRVTRTSQDAGENQSSSRMEIQITQLSLTHEDEQMAEKKDTSKEENAEVFGGSVRKMSFK